MQTFLPYWNIEIHSPIATKILDKQIICGDFLKGDLPTKSMERTKK